MGGKFRFGVDYTAHLPTILEEVLNPEHIDNLAEAGKESFHCEVMATIHSWYDVRFDLVSHTDLGSIIDILQADAKVDDSRQLIEAAMAVATKIEDWTNTVDAQDQALAIAESLAKSSA